MLRATPLVGFLAFATLITGVAAAGTITVTYPSSYFTLGPDGESLNGTAIPIGGTNPIPLDATLTGTFSITTVTVNGASVTILPTFSVTLTDTPTLIDGDNAVIDATHGTNTYPVGVLSWDVIFPGNAGEFDIANLTGPNALPPDFPIATEIQLKNLSLAVTFPSTTTIPEPGTWLLIMVGLGCLAVARGRLRTTKLITMIKRGSLSAAKPVIVIAACLLAVQSAVGQVKLAKETQPSNGVAGVTNVNVIGEGFPSGTIIASDIVVTFSTSCDGSAVAMSKGNSIKKIIGSTERVNFDIPSTITKVGNYFVTLADSASGNAKFTTAAGSCSEVQVQTTIPILNACVAGSSLGVLLPSNGKTGNVTAYVPKGYWDGTDTDIFVDNIEGSLGSSTTITTPGVVNSCSSNPATGQTVCVANDTDVYVISGTTLKTTLHSSSNNFASFSGGQCKNCGVAFNASNNTAAINMGVSGGASGDGVQILDLNTNTFSSPIAMNEPVSENISVDPTRSLILSADEAGNFPILQLQSNGSLKEFDSTFSSGIEDDSSAEDCSTGVAISPGEFSTSIQLVNLNDITFGTSTYSAPNTVTNLSSGLLAYTFPEAGLDGSAVAQGSGHLAVITGEFGGNQFVVLKLPAAKSTGTPSLVDFAAAQIPNNSACGGTFSIGFDPHTITAYTSPNTGDSYAVFAGYSSPVAGVGVPMCLAVVNMTTVIDPTLSPRGGAGFGTHEISPANLPSSAVTFFALK